LFLGGAALVAASPLGLAIAQVRDVLLLGQDVFRVMRIFARCPPSIGINCFHHRPIITRMRAADG